jgi:hypothetical protein
MKDAKMTERAPDLEHLIHRPVLNDAQRVFAEMVGQALATRWLFESTEKHTSDMSNQTCHSPSSSKSS